MKGGGESRESRDYCIQCKKRPFCSHTDLANAVLFFQKKKTFLSKEIEETLSFHHPFFFLQISFSFPLSPEGDSFSPLQDEKERRRETKVGSPPPPPPPPVVHFA